MKTNHTPAPWTVNLKGPFTLGGDIVSVEALTPEGLVSREVATCMLDTDSHPNGKQWLEDAANARLIAAAPELFEEAVETLAEYSVLDGKRVTGNEAKRIERLKALIAKIRFEKTL